MVDLVTVKDQVTEQIKKDEVVDGGEQVYNLRVMIFPTGVEIDILQEVEKRHFEVSEKQRVEKVADERAVVETVVDEKEDVEEQEKNVNVESDVEEEQKRIDEGEKDGVERREVDGKVGVEKEDVEKSEKEKEEI